MKQVRVLKIVVASPGDVQAERDAIPAIVEELNKGIADECSVRLEVYRWETDAYPGFHPEGPQGQIDRGLRIEDCDLLIGIFWKRFGTPVHDAQSGTEHEIRLALESCEKMGRPQLMIYFNQAPHEPQSPAEKDQWQQVLDFKQSLSQKVLWWDYNGKDEFPNLVRQHLTQFIRDQLPHPEDIAGRSLDELLKAYRNQLAQRVSTVRLFGEAETRPLEKVFVELNIIEEYQRPSIHIQWLGLMDAELRRRRDIVAFEPLEREALTVKMSLQEDEEQEESSDKVKRALKPDVLLRRKMQAIIAGAPGCGKTTLLRYLVWKILQEDKRLPVFLELKSITEKDFETAEGKLVNLLFDKAVSGLLDLSSTESEDFKTFFLARLRAGEVTVFLDGLDEVAGAKFFNKLSRTVNEFVHSLYRKNDLIISTRPYALQTRFEELQEMEIAPLSPRQIEEFLKHYYGDDAVVKRLQQHLRRHRELHELARIPFLLGVIAYLYNKQGAIVGERLELYRQIVQQLVIQLDREKLVERFYLLDPDGSLKRKFLVQLAYDRLFVDKVEKDSERLSFTGEMILQKAQDFGQSKRVENPHLLAADVKATPLLREIGADAYAFAHLTLHEYLAAVALSEREDREKIFCRACFNPMLAEMEVLPMMLGLVHEPDCFYTALEQLPESLLFTNLRLRARGLAYAHKIAQKHLTNLTDRLIEFVTKQHIEEGPYLNAVFRSFSTVSGQSLKFIAERLILLLNDKNKYVRSNATMALGEIGSENAVEALLAAFKNEDDDTLLSRAAKALRDIGDVHTAERLLALKDKISYKREKGEIRYNPKKDKIPYSLEYKVVTEALGKIGGERAVDELLAVLKKVENKDVRQHAAEALGKIGDKRTVDGLLAVFKDENENVRRHAVQTLGKIGDKRVVDELLVILKDKDNRMGWQAVKALEKIGGEQVIDAILVALTDDNKNIRERAATLLGKLGNERAVDDLLVALKDEDRFVRRCVAKALGEIGSERAAEDLLALLKDENRYVRLSAVEALNEIGGERAIDSILAALNDKDEDRLVRCAAARAVGKIGGKRAVENLLVTLKDEDRFVRCSAVEALEKIGDEPAIDGLLAVLKDKSINVRRHAAEALGKIGNAQAVESLLITLQDEDYELQTNAIRALGKIGDERAIDSLIAALNHEYWLIRKRVVAALGEIGGERVVNGLLTALKDRDCNVRVSAAEVFKKIDDKRAVEALLAA